MAKSISAKISVETSETRKRYDTCDIYHRLSVVFDDKATSHERSNTFNGYDFDSGFVAIHRSAKRYLVISLVVLFCYAFS